MATGRNISNVLLKSKHVDQLVDQMPGGMKTSRVLRSLSRVKSLLMKVSWREDFTRAVNV